MNNVIYYTKSICPKCFKEITAEVLEENEEIYLKKTCTEHGDYKELIWQDDRESYIKWLEYGGLEAESFAKSPQELEDMYKFDCMCEEHKKQPCSAALMVTNRCNANCPVCFTRSLNDEVYEPNLMELKKLLEFYKETAGKGAPIEFCGGEPTVRVDLPELAQMAKSMGFDYIQLNTNGIRISQSADYCKLLKESGITTIYLGFDGVTKEPYIYKYDKDLLKVKIQAIENCRQSGLAVVLVPCIKPGVNDNQLGEIIKFAKENIPVVKGVYFQPLSYFGIYPPDDRKRITIPEILRKIEEQTNGEITANNFLPGNCEHSQCSFNGYFLLNKNGKLNAVTKFKKRGQTEDSYMRIRENTKKTWCYNEQKYLTIGGMAFQDIWNYDAERIKRCTIQIIGKDMKLIPLCKKYITNEAGQKLYEGIN